MVDVRIADIILISGIISSCLRCFSICKFIFIAMSLEAIESLAHSFDQELKQFEKTLSTPIAGLNSSWGARALDSKEDVHTPEKSQIATPLEHSFELAAAEWERERLHDKLNDLMSRVEELDSHSKYQDGVISELRRKNKLLEGKPDVTSDIAIGPKLNVLNDSTSSALDNEITTTEDTYRLKCRLLQLELDEAKSLLSIARRSADEHRTALLKCETEREREVLRRVQAEKERDAYAGAYEAALLHIEKWS